MIRIHKETTRPGVRCLNSRVYVYDLKAWLRAKRVTVSQMPTSTMALHHNALIGELLQEIEDAEKEG